MTLVDGLAGLVAAAGTVTGVAVLGATRDLRTASRCAVELWTAAGLLHLAADAAWPSIGGAAVVVAVRKVASAGLSIRR